MVFMGAQSTFLNLVCTIRRGYVLLLSAALASRQRNLDPIFLSVRYNFANRIVAHVFKK